MLIQVEFAGSSYVGVFGKSSDAVCVLPPTIDESIRQRIRDALQVPLATLTLGGTTILGSVIAMNRQGAIVADIGSTEERAPLQAAGLRVVEVAGRLNAAGNNILVNDKGGLAHPDLDKKTLALAAETLGVEILQGTVAGLKTVGSAALATNNGVLCHPKVTEEELIVLKAALKVPVDIGTVNHGTPYIGAGLIANSKGAAIGRHTTGPELNRIEDALGYI